MDLLTVQWGLENLLSDLDTHMLNLFGLFDCGGGVCLRCLILKVLGSGFDLLLFTVVFCFVSSCLG